MIYALTVDRSVLVVMHNAEQHLFLCVIASLFCVTDVCIDALSLDYVAVTFVLLLSNTRVAKPFFLQSVELVQIREQ